MERKLAHVEIVSELTPIDGADRIETATILGWQVVVKKGEFKVGEMVVYIEVDSIVPQVPQFSFLENRKYRVKTIKLRKQISQGLVISTKDALEIIDSDIKFSEGQDLTKELGIKKHIPKQEDVKYLSNSNKKTSPLMRFSWYRSMFAKKGKSAFPSGVGKTDEERIQNIPTVIKQHKGVTFDVTEKLDGQSGTFTSKVHKYLFGLISSTEYIIASRNRRVNRGTWKDVSDRYKLERICKKNPGIVIQGEVVAPKVQGNLYKVTEPDFYVFRIKRDGVELNYAQMSIFCYIYDLKIVPFIDRLYLDAFDSVSDVLEYAEGTSLVNCELKQREGVVFKAISKEGVKIQSFKAINNKFLLKHE